MKAKKQKIIEFPRGHDNAPKMHVKCFKSGPNGIKIVPLSDLHIGSKHHNAPLLKQYISYILNTPHCYTIGLGDYIENATKTSVGLGMYEEDFHTPEQFERSEELLRPLVAAGKLIGLHIGNHEMRSTLVTGINPVYMLCRTLNVPYLGYTAFHKWIVGDVVYRVVTLHGRTGAKTISGKINAIRNLRDVAIADLYIMGHMHDRQMVRDVVYEFDKTNDKIVPIERRYIIAGGLLSWPDSYADMQSLSPTGTGLVEISLSNKTKTIGAIL